MALNAVVKPQKLAAVAAEVIEQSLTIPALFQRQGFDQFKGAENDTVYIRVPGILPAREIEDFRAERTASITFDAFTDRKISLTLSGNTYSATKLQDEQKDWDSIQWSRVIGMQAQAVARSLNAKAVTKLTSAPYLATVAGAKSGRTLRSSLIELRRIANAFRMPLESRTLVVGTAVEAAILNDPTLVLAQNVGDSVAEGVLREAFIGRIFGMNIIVAAELAADKGYLIVPSAFALATAAPAVPQSAVGATATAAANGVSGVAARWVLDYDPTILAERSVVNLYNGVRHVTDVFEGVDSNGKPNGAIVNGSGTVGEFLIRGVAFDVDATADVLPDADSNANATGVGGTPAANSLLDQFVKATGVGTIFTP
ncbi:hypothetical protein [Micromonospora sp. NBC_01813]|uniref:hypothetical protein n=1 Tax=Micromonospora sp. NBC_01813 TaxID=2975988 RepID=UPI002DDAD448|nr:hypothetical protein [Micromonospora sp. NBC_01813]WSA11548.1 hypothetical protein OG958_12635 [Micromonospora sp. NBC_01813]